MSAEDELIELKKRLEKEKKYCLDYCTDKKDKRGVEIFSKTINMVVSYLDTRIAELTKRETREDLH